MPASGRNIIENPSATKYDAGLDSERRERVEELYRCLPVEDHIL